MISGSHTRNALQPWSSSASNSPNPSTPPLLPPIRQIHPGLGRHSFTTSSNHLRNAHHEPGLQPLRTPHQTLGTRKVSEAFDQQEGADDDVDTSNALQPKKKRRRQALSCTECKRRKIKCDRANPCSQCTKRNEQSRCQWHIIEPIEKCVTRAEYEELKSRVAFLTEEVQRLQRIIHSPQPDSQRAVQGVSAVTTEAVTNTIASGLLANPTFISRAESKRPNSPQGHPRHDLEKPYMQPDRRRTPELTSTGSTPCCPTPCSLPSSPHEKSEGSMPRSKTSRHSIASLVSGPSDVIQFKKHRSSISPNDSLRCRPRPSQILAGQVAH